VRDRRPFVLLIVVLFIVSNVFGSDRNTRLEPIPVDSLFGMTVMEETQWPAMTSDGKWVAFTLEDRRHRRLPSHSTTLFDGCRVVIADTSSGKLTEVTPPGYSAWMPSWSPDNSRLAFFADDGTGTYLWLWGASGQSKRVTSRPVRVLGLTEIRWIMHGSAVVIAISDIDANRPNPSPSPTGSPEQLTVQVRISPPQMADASSKSTSRAGETEPRLTRVDVNTGEMTDITAAYGVAAVAPDGSRFVYASHRSDINRKGGAQYQQYWDLWLASVNTNRRVRLAEAAPLGFPFSARVSWSPDGRYVAYRTLGLPEERKIVIIPVASDIANAIPRAAQCDAGSRVHEAPLWDEDSTRVIFANDDSVRECSATDGGVRTLATVKGFRITQIVKRGYDSIWSPARKKAVWILARSTAGSTDAIYEVDLGTGAMQTIYEGQRTIGGISANQICASSHGDIVVFSSESATDPPDLWRLGNGQGPTQLTTLNPALSQIEMGKREFLEWTTAEGQKSRGLVLLPAGYEPGRRYPMIVWVYSHATDILANGFGLNSEQFYNLQMFATRGYVVLFPDVTWNPGTVMRGIADQVLPAIDQAVKSGIADPGRIGVIGHSSGAYDVLALLVQSDRFHAALLSGGAVYDFASTFAGKMNFTPDWVMKQMGLGVPPWRAPQVYVDNSPVYHLDRITTPLLMLEGLGDDAWNVTQSEYLFSALNFLGKQVEYRGYAGEEHAPEWWTAANKRDAEVRMLNWFSEYLHGVGAENESTAKIQTAGH